MRVACVGFAVVVCLASPCAAKRPLLRTYLTFNFGIDVLTENVHGEVIEDRALGLGELGIGYQINDRLLAEATYGWLGRHERPAYVPLDPFTEYDLTPAERTFRVTLNPLLFRLRYAPAGHRVEYAKPEFSLGAGFYQVTRLLRNIPNVPPEETSQLLPAVEAGISALFVFSRNFMGYTGGRFAVTGRDDIVEGTRHFDGLTLLLGFRVFLPSPRDVDEP